MKLVYLALSVFFLVSVEAGAREGGGGGHLSAIYLEPFLGYASGSVTFTTANSAVNVSVASKENMKGVTFGGRLGLRMMFIAAGIEGEGAPLKFDGGGGWSEKDIGAFLGVFAPFGFRAWGTYYFSSSVGGLKGTGYKLGLGYQLIRHISLNAEYITHQYKDTSPTAVSTVSTKSPAYAASLGIPF